MVDQWNKLAVSFLHCVGPNDAVDYDGYTQHQQGATLPEQGR